MRPIESEDSDSGLGMNDILFMLFRHKLKITFCALAGLAAAAFAYLYATRNYESSAKLLVRYVVERTIDAVDSQLKTAAVQADSIINSEVEILTSLDLATEVVESVGVDRFLPNSSKADGTAEAVHELTQDMKVVALKGSNVITISYRNRDAELARTVLDQFVQRYFDKHLEAHRSLGAFQFVTQQTDKVRLQLQQTEKELAALKESAGVLSLADSTASVNSRMTKGGQELLVAEAELAGQQARLKEMQTSIGSAEPSQSATSSTEAELGRVSNSDVQRYQFLGDQIAQLRKTELEMLAKYTPRSNSVRVIQSQMYDLNAERNDLEKKHPVLLAILPKNASANSPQNDMLPERTKLAAAAAKVDTLRAQLKAAEEFAGVLGRVGPKITELEHKKEVEEANLKYFESSLEKASIDEALDPTKIPNISIIQKPSIGMKVAGQTKKLVLALAGGGVGLGVGLALLIELLLNRSVRRPLELETRLQIPQLLAIPYLPDRAQLQLKSGSRDLEPRSSVMPWGLDGAMRPFAEEIRDRLILSFKLENLTHKPKLVGIAGLRGDEGASTIASSLAAALSETGDGKVLLVDMYSGHATAHPFFDGKPASGLAEALEQNGSLPAVKENLYLASGVSEKAGNTHLAGKRFYSLIPNLRASHFDYIIFDLPPINVGSATLAISGCLDKLLFVVEAERSDRDEVKRAYTDLVAAKANVVGVLNKVRSSGPKWFHVQ